MTDCLPETLVQAWRDWAAAAGHVVTHYETGRAYPYDPPREAFFAGAAAAIHLGKAGEITRTERLITSLFSNWSLPMGIEGETDEQAEIQAARRMVRFVRVIEKELDTFPDQLPCGHRLDGSMCNVTCSNIYRGEPSANEVMLVFSGRIPMSFATSETFRVCIQQGLFTAYPRDYQNIADLVVHRLFEATRPLDSFHV